MRVVLALLCIGCAPYIGGAEHPPRAHHAAVLDVLTSEWLSAGLPWHSACDEERERIGVAVVDDETMRRDAYYCASGGPTCLETASAPNPTQARIDRGCLYGACVAGTIAWRQSEPWPIGLTSPWRVTLIVSEYEPEAVQLAAIVHEGAHWLLRCSSGDSSDPYHRDERVWGGGGLVDRVTGMVQ